jgi:hypothetical protein
MEESIMKKNPILIAILLLALIFAGCATGYQIKPLPLKPPSAFPNMVNIEGSQIAARAFADPKETEEAFGFDILGAGMLPVEVVFDNQGTHPLEIVAHQTFLEDAKGNLWPILSDKIAYERATKYAETKKIFKEGAYSGFLGAAAGTIIGGAIGIVSGSNVGEAAGKGAALGAAAGATLGGAKAYASDDARREIISDLREKSLQNKPVEPKDLAYGFLFFPGEAKTAKSLRLQIRETDTGKVHVLNMNF